MHQESLENMKLVAQFRSIDIFAMPLYFPVRHSHCTKAKFTVLVSCSGELAVHSFAWSNLRANFFWCWCLLRNNIMAANLQRFASSYDRRRFTTCCVWTLVLPTGPRQGEGRGGQCPGAALLVKRRNSKWSFTNEREVRFKFQILVKVGPIVRPGLAGSVPV